MHATEAQQHAAADALKRTAELGRSAALGAAEPPNAEGIPLRRTPLGPAPWLRSRLRRLRKSGFRLSHAPLGDLSTCSSYARGEESRFTQEL
jgi:hypothetical protein